MKFKRFRLALEMCALPKDVRYFGYRRDEYDGDFWNFGFWYFHVYLTNNPHFYLTPEEIQANIEAWELKKVRPSIK